MGDEHGDGSGDVSTQKAGDRVVCPSCGSGLALSKTNGSAVLEIETTGRALPAAAGTMFIDPHAHMISRTTDDYESMARAGVVAVIEPSFWLGQPRTNLGSYVDYLSTILGFEKFRAGQFGIRHYCCIGLNPEETVREVLERAYFAGFSIYPHTKMGNERLTEIVRHYGPERITADSACDWGVSDPLAVPKTAALMAERGIPPDAIRKVTYAN